MKITGFALKDIFLKDNICLLRKNFLRGICRPKNSIVNKCSNTVIFNMDNKKTLVNFFLKLSFFVLLAFCTLILCFLPDFFNIRDNIKELQALPPSPFILPLSGELAVKFRQEYFDEIEQVIRKHTGVDIAGGPGDKVIASGNGIVAYTGFSAIGGRTIVIKHNDKIRSTYLNILDCFVTKDERLSKGDIIASIGADDDPSLKEPHLHFGIIYMDSYLDPEDIFSIDYTGISRFISLEYINPDISLQINRG